MTRSILLSFIIYIGLLLNSAEMSSSLPMNDTQKITSPMNLINETEKVKSLFENKSLYNAFGDLIIQNKLSDTDKSNKNSSKNGTTPQSTTHRSIILPLIICLAVGTGVVVFLIVYVYVFDGPRVGKDSREYKMIKNEKKSKKTVKSQKNGGKPLSTISGSLSKANSSNVAKSGVAASSHKSSYKPTGSSAL